MDDARTCTQNLGVKADLKSGVVGPTFLKDGASTTGLTFTCTLFFILHKVTYAVSNQHGPRHFVDFMP